MHKEERVPSTRRPVGRPPGHGPEYEKRKREITDIAAQLFAERGYAATGIAELSEAAGIGRGGLYHYIGSKEDLLVEIQDRVLTPSIREFRRIAALSAPPAVRLRLLSEVALTQSFERPHHVRVYQQELRTLVGDRLKKFVKRRQEAEDVAAQLLAEAVDVGHFVIDDLRLGTMQFWNMHNYTYQWARPNGRWSAALLSAAYCRTLFRGFAAPGFDADGVEREAADLLQTERAVLAAGIDHD